VTDEELQGRIRTALDYESGLDASEIGVVVDRGIAALRGNVASQADKMIAERVALRVHGLKGVLNALAVRVLSGRKRRDADIVQAAELALRRNAIVPNGQVTVTVRDGRMMLDGTVAARDQKDAAARAVQELTGVRSLVNNINVSSHEGRPPLDTARRSS
jgi:osmotically-inducible protein OsmY